MRFSKKFLNEKYKVLPENTKDLMGSIRTADIIQEIVKKHQLHIDIAGLLSKEITYVMVGAEKATNFIKNLKIQLKLPDEKVNAIAKDVNEQIFLQIRKLMMESTEKPEAKVEQEPKEIHHPSLNHLEARLLSDESEEIKEQIKQQQAVKPTVAPPSNLPTQPDNKEESIEQSSYEGDASPRLVSHGLKSKKPSHIDPYREPIE